MCTFAFKRFIRDAQIIQIKNGKIRDFDHNQINSLDATSFSGLTLVRQIMLRRNQLNSLDAAPFSGLTSLAILDLSYNRISSIDDELLVVLRTVQILDLRYNKLTTFKPLNQFSGSLNHLYLSHNNINSIDATSFSGQTSLTLLDLSFNRISSIDDELLVVLRTVQLLNLRYNKLTTFNPITNNSLGSLNTLGLSGNPIVCCTMKEFVDWTKTVSWRFIGGSCTDFNESTPILSFNTSKCIVPVDGRWSEWNNSTCSVTCGVGIVNSSRTCDSPLPSHGGKQCIGEANITTSCNLVDCPIDGGWGSWSNQTCSVTCGKGIQSRNRSCDSPVPSADGATCNGSSVDTSGCNLEDCPVNGQWGSWSTGPCSVTCGNGIRYRKRSCDSPPASNNGQGCIGSCAVSVICTLEVCPESKKWKGYHGIRLNSRRYHGIRLNSRRYHGRRLISRRYHGIRLNSSRYHGIRLNSRRYHGIRLNSRSYHGIRLNSRRYHGRRLNSRRYHGIRLNSRIYHGRRLNIRRYKNNI
ncbi:properdin-like [Mytilus trossulus]|uniref:properdin-like n=1 Tax=Mytilus trossulus TaxID=6551 RepID=UPI003007C876